MCPEVYVHSAIYSAQFSVIVFHRSMVNWRRGPWYMCILLYVKLIWCSSIPYIYGQLEAGYICPDIYVHSAIC